MRQYDAIPDELTELEQWCCWRYEERNGKRTKIPYDVKTGFKAKSNDESTWSSFDAALQVLHAYDGIGFFFKTPYFGVDLDDVMTEIIRFREKDDDNNIVSEFVYTLNSYAEVSPSGNGVHIICKGKLPEGGRRKGDVEMYDHGRFFTMTGQRIGGVSNIASDVDDKIKFLHSKYIGNEQLPKEYGVHSEQGNDLTIEEIITKAVESKNGMRFKLFLEGGWEQFYPSQSEADMAFANDLAFWCARDYEKMDTIFRQSSLMRRKWDEYRGTETYAEITLNKAISECRDVFKTGLGDYQIGLPTLQKTGDKLFSYDDTGNAQRIHERFGKAIRYSYINKTWYYYTQQGVWVQDQTGTLKRIVDIVVNDMKYEPAIVSDEISEEDAAKLKQKHIKTSRNHTGKKNMLKETEHLVPVEPEDFDRDDYLLNVQNGYLNLSTGILSLHDVDRMFSKISYAEFTDKIDCPQWEQFLEEVFLGDKELIHYIQKAVGYSLTGSTREQNLFILYGNGRNGKSVFLDILNAIMGTYAINIQPQTIMVKQGYSSHTSDIARLANARFVTTTEPNEGTRLDEGLVKQLTGGDKVTASFKYGAEFEFTPKFKIWMATNHKPIVRGRDEGIWRRLHMIPFNLKLKDSEVDKELKYKLKAELPAILNWAVQGCMMWQREGLKMPKAVLDSVKEYRQEMDVIAAFIDECCIESPNVYIKATDLYGAYKDWAKSNENYLMSHTKFGVEITDRGYEKTRKKNGYNYHGIDLRDDLKPYSINLPS
ncbi:phage/plasmid primase, P4 family [Aerococcaceae bacterium NML130460]|nr:phage/plasmid primase, P4 family [Aerococcaceae bacterium NML130460]